MNLYLETETGNREGNQSHSLSALFKISLFIYLNWLTESIHSVSDHGMLPVKQGEFARIMSH